MFVRPVPMVLSLMLLSAAGPASAQRGALEGAGPRTDVLTGEPVRPRSGQARPEPEIFNAPHAPRQQPGRQGADRPMDIYVAPQIGAGNGTGYPGNNGFAGQPPRRPVQQGQGQRFGPSTVPYPPSPYPGRLRQGNPY